MGLVFDMDWCFDRDSQELDVYQVSFIDLHYMNMNFLRLVVPLQWRGPIRKYIKNSQKYIKNSRKYNLMPEGLPFHCDHKSFPSGQ